MEWITIGYNDYRSCSFACIQSFRSKRFYHDILGLHHTASYPGALFFAANSYHHHIATNTWIGTNIFISNNNNYKPGLNLCNYLLNREEMIG